MKGVAISQWCGYFRKWCGYFILVWLFHFGVAIYENGVAISFSISRAPVGAKNRLCSGGPYQPCFIFNWTGYFGKLLPLAFQWVLKLGDYHKNSQRRLGLKWPTLL